MSVLWLDTVGSTNDYLKQHGNAPHGTAVATDRQTAGRGRRGRVWQHQPQGLALSVVLDGVYPALPLVCALAVGDALTALTGKKFGWKWPNDLLADGRKIGGILCEGAVRGDVARTVAGIGLNLRGTAESFAAAGLPYADSVEAYTAQILAPRAVAEEIVARLLPLVETLAAQGMTALLPRYAAGCVTLGREVEVCAADGSRLCGTAIGLEADGALRLRTAEGECVVRAGEVSVRGLYGYV